MLKYLMLGIGCLVLSSSINADEFKVLAISGSTREDSANKKLLSEAVAIARQMGATVTIVDLKDYTMPFYDADLEKKEGQPENAKHLRKLMFSTNAIMIASPEYNSSLSGVLKNALDWCSRNEQGQPCRDAIKGKKIAIMSASPGAGGGVRGLGHLRSIIESIGGQVITQQVILPNSYDAFDDNGKLKDEKIKLELKQLVEQLLKN